VKAIVLALILFSGVQNLFAQQDILKGTLSEYGRSLKYIQSWTDDEYIVMLAKGGVGKSTGYIYLFILPDKGVVATHVVSSFSIVPANLFSTNPEKISLFFSKVEGLKTAYYSVNFSKEAKTVESHAIANDIKEAEKQDLFSFVLNGRLLFASASKDKTRIAFRELSSEGEASVSYEFDMPDTLRKILDLGLIKVGFEKEFERKVYLGEDNVILLAYRQGKRQRIDVVDFDLQRHKLSITSHTEKDDNPFAAAFAGNNVFVMRTGSKSDLKSNNTVYKYYDLSINVYAYPSFEKIKTFVFDKTNQNVPFRTSSLNELVYHSGLYFNGNFKFKDHRNEFNPMGILQKMYEGIPFFNVKQTSTGNYLVEIGSQKEELHTNVVVSYVNRFFGCMESKFEPCKDASQERMPTEKMLEYLETVQKEDPEFAIFGIRRVFMSLYFNKSKEFVVKEF
jgi:hypothetical protein